MMDIKVKNKSLRKLKRDVEAVSPVVATLMLVLIAVAAAAAFYLWESNWQNQQSEQMSNSDIVSGPLTVAGSTTINEFMNYAAPAYMDANPSVKVTIDSIGSGAGMKSLVQGTCDIAMMSASIADTASGAGNPDTTNMVGTTIGYDGIVMFVSNDALGYHSLTAADLKMTQAISAGVYNGTYATWGALETAIGFAGNDSHAADALAVHYRADSSGTQDDFAKLYMGVSGYFTSTQWTATNSKLANMHGSNGNPGMINDVESDHDAIGFASFGMISNSAGKAVAFSYGADLTNQVAPTQATILAHVKDATTGYGVARPLMLVTMGQPTAVEKSFIDFCTDPANNVKFCADTGYISLYA